MTEQQFNVSGSIHATHVGFGNDHHFYGGSAVNERPGTRPAPVFGIVTALPEEFAAVRAVLDDAAPPHTVAEDRARYVLGTLPSADGDSPHTVVLTLLGDTGNNAAAESCANLIRSFPTVDTVVMCGIACGVPCADYPERHVRLGDIVVATWGIADYDHVVDTDQGRRPRQPFPLPSPILVRLARYLAAVEISGERPWEKWISTAIDALPQFARPAGSTDAGFTMGGSSVLRPHPPAGLTGHRPDEPKVHHGLIGSADRSLRSARVRDDLAGADRILAFEMEGKGIGAAGFAGGLEWFVVRGISDYGDASTGSAWRGYAAVVAAGYTRALLAECPPLRPRGGHTMAAG
jgi:nucleoside phosphorylase